MKPESHVCAAHSLGQLLTCARCPALQLPVTWWVGTSLPLHSGSESLHCFCPALCSTLPCLSSGTCAQTHTHTHTHSHTPHPHAQPVLLEFQGPRDPAGLASGVLLTGRKRGLPFPALHPCCLSRTKVLSAGAPPRESATLRPGLAAEPSTMCVCPRSVSSHGM